MVVMVMDLMVIYSALVRSHQSTYEGSFGSVPPAHLSFGDAAAPQTVDRLRPTSKGHAPCPRPPVKAETVLCAP